MNVIEAGRAFMGITMAFHIFFALFGVGIPLMVSLAELIGIVKKDADFMTMAKRWTFAMTVLFVAGAISGRSSPFCSPFSCRRSCRSSAES